MKNEPAFPQVINDHDGNIYLQHEGLTKREYFAALAMQGYIIAGCNGMPSEDIIAVLSVSTADALIKELEKKD